MASRPRLTVTITVADQARLEHIAKRRGIPVATVARELLHRAVAEEFASKLPETPEGSKLPETVEYVKPHSTVSGSLPSQRIPSAVG